MESLAAGWDHTCAVTSHAKRVLCWGSNWHGQLGVGHRLNVGSTPESMPPAAVPLELPALQVRLASDVPLPCFPRPEGALAGRSRSSRLM